MLLPTPITCTTTCFSISIANRMKIEVLDILVDIDPTAELGVRAVP